jgi:hypothetical protein
MKAPTTQNLRLYELKQHKQLFHEEYLQHLFQMKQAKIQLVTGSQTKQCTGSKHCKTLSLYTVREKNI